MNKCTACGNVQAEEGTCTQCQAPVAPEMETSVEETTPAAESTEEVAQ